MILFNVIFLSFIFYSKGQNSLFGNLPIVSDLTPENCFEQGKKYDVDTSILPKCIPFEEEVEGSCIGYNTPDLTMINKPKCDKNGAFAPVQCKGERTTGRCFCFDSKGSRIFGQQWWSRAQNMTCACSRKKAEMADSVYFNSLHCNSMGNYETLQCDVLSGMCWCVDEKTGELKSTVVPDKAVSKLPCYSSSQIGTQYLRQCESKKYAENRIVHELISHGTQIHLQEFLCDDDGSFGPYTIIDGSAYCTWRDNTKIGSWQAGNNRTNLNCNCARDTKIFQEVGKKQTQQCSSGGNYEEYQMVNSNTYCVDLDGYLKSPTGVIGSNDCLNYIAYH